MGLLRRRHSLQPAPSDDPDAQLVAWAQADPHAFVALYDRYFPAVYGYCLGELGEADPAEDAASETFLKALTALPRYRESGRFRPWLFVIAHNAVQDTIRARRSHGSLEAAADVSDPDAGPEEQAIAAADRQWLEAVIACLPAEERRVLELRRAGLRGVEIAQVLGISHEAAKKRQLRAMDPHPLRARSRRRGAPWSVASGSGPMPSTSTGMLPNAASGPATARWMRSWPQSSATSRNARRRRSGTRRAVGCGNGS